MEPGCRAKSVVVTGASTGIGRASALALDGAGFLVFAGVRRTEDGEQLQRDASPRLRAIVLDVTAPPSIGAAVRAVEGVEEDGHGAGFAGLVNNAGIAVAAPLELVALDDLRHQLEVNVVGTLSVTQAFLPLLRRARGRLVNVGSSLGRVPLPFLGPYCASKAALASLTSSLRMELRPWGIAVSLIEAGSVATPIWQKSIRRADASLAAAGERSRSLYGAATDAMRASAARRSRSGVPPDAVARAVMWALTARRPRARYLVGADARLQALPVHYLPDRLREWIVLRAIGMPRGR
jgi:NAD(P)-dependent dehydrogenase (short-subunit alcohol dehydrogenase family)